MYVLHYMDGLYVGSRVCVCVFLYVGPTYPSIRNYMYEHIDLWLLKLDT